MNRKVPDIVVHPPTPEPIENITQAFFLTTGKDQTTVLTSVHNPLNPPESSCSLKVRYGPQSFYTDVEGGKYCINCEKRHQNICT